jgi:hypothetical protein
MTSDHVGEAMLDGMARRELAPDELLFVARHLQSCPACAARARERAAPDLSALRRELVSPESAAPRRGAWILAAAAAVAALAVGLFVIRDATNVAAVPQRPRTTSAPRRELPRAAIPDAVPAADEWQRMVAEATASGALPFPADLAELRGTPDIVRGESGVSQYVAPAGVVVEDPRPLFTWSGSAARTYTVFVFDGQREIARSRELREARWRPESELPHGRVLAWQVEVSDGDDVETIPRPPSPMAMFRIVSERDRRDLDRARTLHPHNDLLAAVLYARAGLREQALAALRRVPRSGATAKILDRNPDRP